MSTRTKTKKTGRAGLGPLAVMAVAGGAYAFVKSTDVGRRLVVTMRRDMCAIRERDPAARSELEIITCYPGLHALWLHRVAHVLWQHKMPLVPRLISQTGRLLTGIEIHPGAVLGDGLFIDHGAGVVIGETSEIGENVTVYQGVTLGGTGKETGKRHPTIGDNVVIGAGSLLLGSISIGEDARVGAGSVIVHDVPPRSTVVGNPGRPVIMEGAKVGVPDIDYTHLPDPVAEAMKCLVRRVVQLENELDEIRAGHASAPTSGDGSPAVGSVSDDEEACDPERLDGTPDI